MLFSLTMLPPLLVSHLYQDGTAQPFLGALVLLLGLGALIWLPVWQRQEELKLRDGFLVVVLFWTVLGLSGALPFILSSEPHLSVTDAVFESVSGLTTTGATVIVGLDDLPLRGVREVVPDEHHVEGEGAPGGHLVHAQLRQDVVDAAHALHDGEPLEQRDHRWVALGLEGELVGGDPDDEVVTSCAGLLQQMEVSHVEHVEHACCVADHSTSTWLRKRGLGCHTFDAKWAGDRAMALLRRSCVTDRDFTHPAGVLGRAGETSRRQSVDQLRRTGRP